MEEPMKMITAFLNIKPERRVMAIVSVWIPLQLLLLEESHLQRLSLLHQNAMEKLPDVFKIQHQELGVMEVFLVMLHLLLTPLLLLHLQHHRPLELQEAVPRPLHPPPTMRDLRRITIQDQREYFFLLFYW
jgi:hypothetical protein